MTITTHPQIWSHKHLLPLVHQCNHLLEAECGARGAGLVATWGLDESGPRLTLVVVDSATAQAALLLNDVNDLGSVEEAIQKWCAGTC